MTVGAPGKLIFTFALPLMAGNIFQQLYTVVDTMVVGKYLGVNALAALGSADWLNWMMLGIIQGFTQGFAIKMAQEFGAGNYALLRKVICNSTLLSVIFSIFLVIVGLFSARPILELLQTPDTILPDALLYIRIIFAGIPIVMLYNLVASILRSLGDSKTPLNAMIIASITNIVLDVLFVFGFKWGIAGAAIATLIAQIVSGIFCIYHIKKITILSMTKEDFKIGAGLCGHLLLLGLPLALQNAIIAVGGMVIQFVVNGFGVIFIAGITASNKLWGLLEIAATSYGYAMLAYVGQNLGAGKIKRIKRGVRVGIIIATLTSILIAIIMLLSGKFMLGAFLSGTPEEITAAMEVAYYYLAVMSICLPILYLLHLIRSAIQGLGNTFLPMVSGIAELIVRTSGALILPGYLGEKGIYYSEVGAWFGAFLVLAFSYLWIIRKISGTIKERSDNENM